MWAFKRRYVPDSQKLCFVQTAAYSNNHDISSMLILVTACLDLHVDAGSLAENVVFRAKLVFLAFLVQLPRVYVLKLT